jgi:hypothetical protein
MNGHLSHVWTGILILVSALVSGCGIGVQDLRSSANSAVHGNIMGGQQAVSGSTIQIYAAGNTGYGSASSALLSTPAMSDANGGFTITTPYTCPSTSTPAYIVAQGGNPGLGGTVNNGALTLMAALGPCGNLSPSTHVIINEVTTVAAVWALAPFMTAYDHVGSSSTNATGLPNAFAMAANLASADHGQSPGDAPSGSTIPVPEIYTLANILASCINTDGSTDSTMPCGKLFTVVTPMGASAPTETVGAALDIALHPDSNGSVFGSMSPLFQLVSSTGPFQPTLTTAPNDWTVAANFATGGSTTNGVAIDNAGNAFVVDSSALRELSPAGTLLGSYSSMAGDSVALDDSENIWVGGAGVVKKMPATLSTPASFPFGLQDNGFNDVIGLALDGFGNAWYTCDNCFTMGKLSPSGTFSGPYGASSDFHSTFVAIDPSENAWKGTLVGDISIVNNSGTSVGSAPYNCSNCGDPSAAAIDANGMAWIGAASSLLRFATSGTFTSYSLFSGAGGGLYEPYGVAVDGADNIWIANGMNESNAYTGALSEFTNSGMAVTPTLGYVSNTMATAHYAAIDGSGNVWVGNTGNGSVTVFVGVATPVVTPLALGLKNGTLATKP